MKVRFSLIAAAVLMGGLVAPGEGVAQFAAGQKYVGAHIGLSGVGTSAAFGVSGEVAIDKNITVGGQNFQLPLAFSTVRESDSIVRARKEGLEAVLFKPFKVDQLLSEIRAAFEPAA